MNRRTLTLTTLAALLGPQQLLAQTNACPALLNHRFPRLQDGAPQDLQAAAFVRGRRDVQCPVRIAHLVPHR